MTVVPRCEEIVLRASLSDVFASFLDWPDPIFFDSSLVHGHLGRYSYLAADPLLVLRSKDGCVTIRHRDRSDSAAKEVAAGFQSGAIPDKQADPFLVLQRLLRAHGVPRLPGLPPFQGGAAGYFAYDLAQHVEAVPRRAVDDLGVPDLCVGVYDWVLAHDHLAGRTWLIVHDFEGNRSATGNRLRQVRDRVAAAKPGNLPDVVPRGQPVSTFTRDGYLRAVRAAKEHIAAGDIYQVCLSQRLELPMAGHPWDLYRRLRAVSPVPYGAYLGFGDVIVASASPELFLRLDGGRVETRPIKGTRPRSRTWARDRALKCDLATSEKDRAENLMIVDLLRNDLGRVCGTGSVRVPELFAIESYSTVHHLVSTVAGTLVADLDAVDLLRACFPGGSVTGCPKIRAMEIIDELEPTRRGVYCGAIGFLGFDGSMDTSVVIRTIVVKDGRAYLQVGGAIVADSDPEAEYQETLDKAQAALLALSHESASATNRLRVHATAGRAGRQSQRCTT